jgi:hypothetical protein
MRYSRPRSKPDPGNPAVRDCRGAYGNVGYGQSETGTYSGNAETAKLQPKIARAVFLCPTILDVLVGLVTIIFGTSRETSDFVVDCLQQWWDENKQRYTHITQLVINLDNGPELASRRTQFMARMVEFAEQNGLEVILVYYPPYHSKYNPFERCWGILEAHWNGSLLDSIEAVCEWARSMTWKGIAPTVHLLDKIYKKGVSLTKKAFQAVEERLKRDKHLPKYSVLIPSAIT